MRRGSRRHWGYCSGSWIRNEFAHRVFGEKFCRMYGEGKKEEWERFCAYVTDWETAEYLYRC